MSSYRKETMTTSTLIVTATALEIAPCIVRETGDVVEGFGRAGTLLSGPRCDILLSGVGQLQCAFHVGRILSTGRYGRVLQAGIGGSFVDSLPLGSVAVVGEEVLGDLGAEDRGSFLDLFDMGLLSKGEFPFADKGLLAPVLDLKALQELPRVRSLTVNRVLGESHSIAWAEKKYSPQVVNMEGAALFYACLQQGVPFLSLRSISDRVGPRDKSSWDIQGAVSSLDRVLRLVLPEFLDR